MADRVGLYRRSLAKDGARRAEIRAIQRNPLIDYSGAAWGEWITLQLVSEGCAALAEPSTRGLPKKRTGE